MTSPARAVKNLIVTGKPGVGKTTLVKEAVWPYRQKVGGFYTEEVVEGRQRLGFRLRTFRGEEGLLASKRMASPHRLNKYGVDLAVLETLGIASVRKALDGKALVVIDEIGSMEMMSAAFRATVLECLGGPKPVLATIRQGAQPFTDSIKALDRTKLRALTRENFGQVREEVRAWVEDAVGEGDHG